jgi:hypothetical protein
MDVSISGKDVRVGGMEGMEGLQVVQPRGRTVCEIFECYNDPASISTPVQRCHHVPSRRDIVKWYMFLDNGLTMSHTGGRVRDRNREEDIRQAIIQSPRKSRQFFDDTCNNHWCGRDGPNPWSANSTRHFSCGCTSSHLCTD